MPKTPYQDRQQRLEQIEGLIRERDQTANALLEILRQNYPDLSRRAVNDYLRELQDQGKILKLGNQRSAFYRQAPQPFHPVDALVLHSALRMLYHHTPGYNGRYFQALTRLAGELPEPAQHIAKASTKALSARKSQRSLDQDQGRTLERLAEGWFSGRMVKFEYKKHGGSGAWRGNLLEVYFIEINRANLGLYVIGMERGFHNAVRTFKVNRIRKVEVTEVPYTIDPRFDPQDFLFNAWGVMGRSGGGLAEVHLRFKPEAADWVEEINYPGVQKTRRNPDHSLEVWLEVGTDSQRFPREVFSWIQGWGPRVEVLGPDDLRERWLEEARQVAALGGESGAV